MAGKRKANRKGRSKDDADAERERADGATRTVQRSESATRQATGRDPLLADATLSPEQGDIVPTKTPREQANQQRQSNIQRAMQGTGTSQDEVPDQVLDVVGSGGMPLERSVQDSLEDRMDADFSDVRIHTGAKAAEAADAIDAKAFTCGNSIVFNSGEYDPSSPEGQFLLAHELAHVKQQNGGAPLSMMPQENADLEIDPDPQLERDADRAAEEALSGEEPLTVNRLGTDVHVQRAPKFTDYVASTDAQERFLDNGGEIDALDTDPEKIEELQSKVEELEDLAQQISELGDEMGVSVTSTGDGTTITEQTQTPIDDGMSLTVSDDADIDSLDLSQQQTEVVQKHRQLIEEFGNTVEELISDLQGDIPEESTLKEILTDGGIDLGVAGLLYKAVESGTDYHTLAEMLATETDTIGAQGGALIENIVIYFGALLTAVAVRQGYDKLTSDDTGEGDDPYQGGDS
ncbi:eCIS core domain-containing protein [Halomicrobium katesii]|uniref:eCIS core domain-containing protein n=1 Tax=Halomicrobium katesii TaxID=437163 RepID=UPI0003709E40|nr:DUF4157 domain-containing protein [Halomicrobium katesii]